MDYVDCQLTYQQQCRSNNVECYKSNDAFESKHICSCWQQSRTSFS